MAQNKKECTSCGKVIGNNAVIFKCPGCGKTIYRCTFCKKLGVKYKCGCGFEGP